MSCFPKVIAESEQVRRETDNVGPRDELNYWKKRMTKFNFLLDQIKTHEVKGVLTILQIVKSKLIQVVKIQIKEKIGNLFFFVHSNGKYSMEK